MEEVFVPIVLDDTDEDIWDSNANFLRRKHGKPYDDGPVYNESYYGGDNESEHSASSVKVIRRNTLVARRVLFEQVAESDSSQLLAKDRRQLAHCRKAIIASSLGPSRITKDFDKPREK